MRIELVYPSGDTRQPKRRRAPRPRNLDGLTIGLLSNQKANAENILIETARLFEENHQCRVLDVARKPDASRTADPEVLRQLSEKSDILITAAGD